MDDINDFLDHGAVIALAEGLLLGWGKPLRLSFDSLHPTAPAFYCPDFFLSQASPWRQYPQWDIISSSHLSKLLGEPLKVPRCQWQSGGKEQFQRSFQGLQQMLQKGALEKGVPYIFSESSSLMDKERLKMCLKNLLAVTTGHLYGHWSPSGGVLGVTPETLFNYDFSANKVHTMALAGTSPLNREAFTPKEHHEHAVVVKGIVEALQPLGQVEVEATTTLSLKLLKHLMTPIQVALESPFHFTSLVERLHPTPALGAFPKEAGQAWLQEFDRHTPRHFYGAPVGCFFGAQQRAHCFVAIRNVQWTSSGMRMGAGCGVVAQSECEKEWEELTLKTDAIRSQLGI